MRRGWFLLLCLSLGLNAALLFVVLTGRVPGRGTEARPAHGPERFFRRWEEAMNARDHDGKPGPRRPGHGEHAFPPGEIRDSLMHWRLRHLYERLDVDEEQRAALEDVLSDMLPQMMDARMAVFQTRREIFAAVGQEELDPDHIRDLVRAMSEAQTRLDSLMMESILSEAGHLTPEQRATYFRAMPWQQHGPRGDWRKRGPGKR